jgi:hypothetical protein
MYGVAVEVSDGTTTILSATWQAPVEGDSPPCMTGAAPPPGSFAIDRLQPYTMEVTNVTDDLDALGQGLTFVWTVWRDGDPSWRTLGATGTTYTLDASAFAVGEHVRVRAQAVDRTGPRTTGCSIDDDACAAPSCLTSSANSCQAWMTWDLELR